MARPFGNTRNRHYLMQAVMWLIFAGTLGIAALASRARSSGGAVLGDRIDLRTISVRLPARWKFFDRGEDAIFAAEHVGSANSRFIVVEEHQAGFLERMFTANADEPRSKRSRKTQTIPMGPITGMLSISTQAQPMSLDGESELGPGHTIITAKGELEPGHTITVSLETLAEEDELDPEEIDLVKRVAASIKRVDGDSPQIKPPG